MLEDVVNQTNKKKNDVEQICKEILSHFLLTSVAWLTLGPVLVYPPPPLILHQEVENSVESACTLSPSIPQVALQTTPTTPV